MAVLTEHATVLVETTETLRLGDYTTEWHCTPPEPGRHYVIDLYWWVADVLRVFAWHYGRGGGGMRTTKEESNAQTP